jgi:NADH:ubiquinone oxidoreductase subunit E
MGTQHKPSVTQIIRQFQGVDCPPVLLLQSIQKTFGYLPEEAVRQAAQALDIPLSRLFSVASFYTAFSFEPPGQHTVCVCEGTACHVKGAAGLSAAITRDLGLHPGENTSPDRLFTLKKVRCLGCCSMAPVVKVGEQTFGSMTQAKTAALLKQYRKQSRQ